MSINTNMEKTDLAYAAGIVDGEGCITLVRRRKYYAVQLSVGNTNEWLINWLHFNFGGNIVKWGKLENCKQVWNWILSCQKACEVIKILIPYLKIKRLQAELALEFQSRRKRVGVKGRSNQEAILDEANKILMTSYNKRGDT